MMTKEELTWIATVFDCEGCISVQKQKYTSRRTLDTRAYDYVVVQIGHCSFDLIARFADLVGFGKRYTYEHKSGTYLYQSKKTGEMREYNYTDRKQVYWWKLTNRAEIEQFIEMIWYEWLSDYRRETIIQLGVEPMAKHVHTFFKQPTEAKSKYMWKCADCPWFVHAGLEHVLIGKSALCWKCDMTFTMDQQAIDMDKPVCPDCRLLITPTNTQTDNVEIIQSGEEDELSKKQREMREQIYKSLGLK